MFALTPTIGPYAPLNLDLLELSGVAVRLADLLESSSFASALDSLRASGRLLQMADQGWGKLPIDGFDTIARHLLTHFGPQS